MHITINSKIIEILDISDDFYPKVLIDYQSLYNDIDDINKQIIILLSNNQYISFIDKEYIKTKYYLRRKYKSIGYVVLEYAADNFAWKYHYMNG